eukprot:485478-Prymnesium_polylepis.2
MYRNPPTLPLQPCGGSASSTMDTAKASKGPRTVQTIAAGSAASAVNMLFGGKASPAEGVPTQAVAKNPDSAQPERRPTLMAR